MQDVLRAKKDALHDRIDRLGRVVVAYSGGVDSTYLAATCHEVLGDEALAVTAVSPSLARRELEDANGLARRFGWSHRIVGTHEVAREEYARNDGDRCYWCKTELLEVLEPIGRERSAPVALGTNLDDLSDYRPGLRAANERGAIAPLVDAGMSKADVRLLSASMGLPTADKPASPCLSSRIAYGVRVTPARLRRIDRAEDFLIGMGFRTVRVRDHGELARIEVPAEDVPRLVRRRGAVERELRDLGWAHVTVDRRGYRSGSLNSLLPTIPFRSST